MITIKFILLHVSGAQAETFNADMNAIPRAHEYVMIQRKLFRVEDITHVIEDRSIEVRAVSL